ncbi:MAG: 4Fe-4S binding protein [Candidatus Hodarchaeota archaeon]
MGKTKIRIDYSKCGPNGRVDPRNCSKCLKVCDPCVLLRHEDLKIKEKNIEDPQNWQITAVWPSICNRCLKCVDICPEKAILIKW